MANVFGASFRGRADKLQKYLKIEDPSLVHCPGVHFVDGAGNSPLHAACQEGHAACVEILLHAGADFEKLGGGGLPPLMVACEHGRSYCAQLLLEAKANASFADAEHGATALHLACQAGHSSCVSVLLAAGALVDIADKVGATPLVVCAYGGHARCVELLIAYGADDQAAYEGERPLQLAQRLGHAECLRALTRTAAQAPDEVAEAAVDEAPMCAAAGQQVPLGSAPAETSAGEELLSQLQRGIEQGGGLRGAELIEEKRKELSEAQRQSEEAERRREDEEARRQAEVPASAADAKARANALFAAGSVEAAAEMYVKGLELAQAELTRSKAVTRGAPPADGTLAVTLGGAEATGEPPLRAVLQCNLAACRLRQRMWREAIAACDAACALHPRYSKALFRRAQARRSLSEWDGAILDAEAAHDALRRAGDGRPVGDAGKKMAREIERFSASVKAEQERRRAEAERAEREESGITLGAAEDDEAQTVYYHYASQGEKTQDFMWWVRFELRRVLSAVSFERPRGFCASNGFHCRTACVRVTEYDPPSDGSTRHADEAAPTRGTLEGTCTIRTHKGRRSLFFDLSVEVPWRGFANEGEADERSLGGKTRLWNITHFNGIDEWRHQSHRNTNELGPWCDAIAEQLAPAIAAKAKVALQEVVGRLMYERIDPSVLAPPSKPAKPKPTSRAWGKGTLDYSKFDHIDDEEEDDEEQRVEDLTEIGAS